MESIKVIDIEIDLKENYRRELNYKMKLQKEEEETAFQMNHPKPFEVKAKVVNNATEYFRLDSFLNVLIPIETYRSEHFNSKGKQLSKINNELETAVSSKGNSSSLLPSDNPYEGDRAKNNENKVKDKCQEQKGNQTSPACSLNEFAGTAPNINEMVDKTSKLEIIRRKLKSNLKLIGACLAVMVMMMAVAGLCYMVYYFTLSSTQNTNKKTTETNDVLVTIYDVPVDTNDVPLIFNDVPVTTYDVPVDTNDVPMTTNDAECLNVKANCNTSMMEKKVTENRITRKELVVAAGIGNVTQVCELLKCGASINSRDRQGVTPLWIAAFAGHVNVVQLLLAYKASVDKTKLHRSTPLYIASNNGHKVVVKLLLAYGASVDKASFDLSTPLYSASKNGHKEVVNMLLTYGASVDKAQSLGYTPLLSVAHSGNMYIAKLLLTYNASVDKASSNGNTPLHIAADYGHVDFVQLLLKYNGSVNKSDKYGWAPLHGAVYGGSDTVVELLCTAGAKVNAQTGHSYRKVAAGSTALHIAVIKRNKRIVKTLIMFHKTELLKNKNGLTAVDISRKQKSLDIIKELHYYAKLLKKGDNYSKFSQ